MATNPVTPPTTPPSTWPYWAAGCIALVGFGWFVATGHDNAEVAERATMPAAQTDTTVGSRTPNITAGELKTELSASISTVRIALLGMTNSDSAQAALPQLEQAAARLDRVNELVDQLPLTSRRGVAIAFAPTAARLNQLFDKVLSKPDVAGVAKPTIDELRAKLQALART